MIDSETPDMVYYEKEPDIPELALAFTRTVGELNTFFEQTRESYRDRRNIWPGKQRDLRKHGANAFPWDGASDQEVHIIGERIETYVSLFLNALSRASIRAYPVEVGDLAASNVTSSFLKFMVSSYIEGFRNEAELDGNRLLEKGLAVTYVGWQQEVRSFLQKVTIEEIASQDPEVAEMIMTGEDDDELAVLVQGVFPGLKDKRAKRAIRDLRNKGAAEIPVARKSVERPQVRSLSVDSDIFFPPYTCDPQRSPFVVMRDFLTVQEVEKRVTAEGWDRKWADYVIAKCRGLDSMNRELSANENPALNEQSRLLDKIEIVWFYQRLIDEEDGAEGIYCTVFSPHFTGGQEGVQPFAQYELMNGFRDYPFVVTRLSRDTSHQYDVRTMSDRLRGTQWEVKVQRDSRCDRTSMATLPPLMGPPGKRPPDWRPGGYVSERRAGEYHYADKPVFDSGSNEIEATFIKQADRLVGLDYEIPNANIRQQEYIAKFLGHVQDVIKLAFKMFQRFGPDEIWFRVTGVPNPEQFQKGDPEQDFDITISFDVMMNDPDFVKTQAEQFVQLMALDREGRIDSGKLVQFMAHGINPALADAVLMPVEESQQKITKAVTDDLSKIFAGIPMGAQPNGAQLALQIVEQYASQPGVAKRLQEDEAFAGNLSTYAEQYQFQLQQAQNAETGRLGTVPAQMGSVKTQGTNLQPS